MKSLGERLLELRESVAANETRDSCPDDEYSAIFSVSYPYPWHIESAHLRATVAIERAAVRELKKEGKL